MTEEQTGVNDFLDTVVAPSLEGKFIRKDEFAGETIIAKIVGVSPSQYKGKLVLALNLPNNNKDRFLLTIGPRNRNQIIDVVGSGRLGDWIGVTVKMEFSKLKDFDTKEGVKKGCSITFKVQP